MSPCATEGRLPLPPGNGPGPGLVFLISKYVVGARSKARRINRRKRREEGKAGSQRPSWRVSPDIEPALLYSISRPGHIAPVWLQLPQGPHTPATVPSRPLGKRTRNIFSRSPFHRPFRHCVPSVFASPSLSSKLMLSFLPLSWAACRACK